MKSANHTARQRASRRVARFLGRETAQPGIELCNNGWLVTIDDAAHWVQHEEPVRVNQLIVQFLGKHKPESRSTGVPLAVSPE